MLETGHSTFLGAVSVKFWRETLHPAFVSRPSLRPAFPPRAQSTKRRVGDVRGGWGRVEVGEWAQQREEKLGSAGRCGPLAQSGRVGPSSSHDQGARASGRGISVPGTVFAQIEGQQARSDAVTSHLCEPEPALPPPWATVLSSAHAADQMQLLLVRPVRSSTTQSGQTNIGCRGPRGAALRRARRRARARDERRRDRDTHGGSAPRPPGPLPPSARGSALPSPAPARRLPGFLGGPLTWSPAADGGRAGRRGDARSDREGARRRAARGGRAGSRDELGRGAGLPSSSLPPGRARARGAALGRGQRFFVSPAPSARHRGGGPHPGSGAGRFIRDRNVSDYTRVRKRLNKLYGILRNITQFSVDLRSPFS